ncbi:MAG: PEGA domain-containing protein, partial [Flavobacteriaceae bacterium]|nr:PEGA domain-containing protein [Flavobacteriaceae bacterium]
ADCGCSWCDHSQIGKENNNSSQGRSVNIMADVCLLGSVSFVSYPPGAEIFMDGVDQDVKTPAIVTNVPAGSHEYVLKLAGYRDYLGSITVLESQTVLASVNLIPVSSRGLMVGLTLMGLAIVGVVVASNNHNNTGKRGYA